MGMSKNSCRLNGIIHKEYLHWAYFKKPSLWLLLSFATWMVKSKKYQKRISAKVYIA